MSFNGTPFNVLVGLGKSGPWADLMTGVPHGSELGTYWPEIQATAVQYALGGDVGAQPGRMMFAQTQIDPTKAGLASKALDAKFKQEHQAAAQWHEQRAKELHQSLWLPNGNSKLTEDLMTPDEYSAINTAIRAHKDAAESHNWAVMAEARDNWKGLSQNARDDSMAALKVESGLPKMAQLDEPYKNLPDQKRLGPKGPKQMHPEDVFGTMHNVVEKVEKEIKDLKDGDIPPIDIEMAISRKYPGVEQHVTVKHDSQDAHHTGRDSE